MKILSIDTSTKNFSLAVADGNKILRSKNVVLKRVLSSSIIPGINNILKSSGLPLKQLDGFAVGLGPGSFTSLRVGLATVKALSYATGKPVVGIPSLDVLAMNGLGHQTRAICTICDARRQLVYACRYKQEKMKLSRISPYGLTPIEDFIAQIEGQVLFIGDAISLYRNLIWQQSQKTKKFKPIFIDEKKWFPQAKNLIPLTLERFRKKKSDDIDKLVPLYLYPHDCQIRK